MNILITICARGGSKGIPGKNIKMISGKPLIYYTIEVAKKFSAKYKADIEISTDSEEIKNISKLYGINTDYTRPLILSTDDAGKVATILDLLHYKENKLKRIYDYVIDLDVTSPLRNLDDIEISLQTLVSDSNALNIFSVNYANRNPYFNMVERKSNGYYDLIKEGPFLTRQSAPEVFELNASIYIYKRKFFEDKACKVINDKSLIYLMPHFCFDLDHNIDFEFMSYLFSHKKIGFEL